MPEINLLPDELRGKEQKELESVRKNPKLFSVEMSSPRRDKVKDLPKAPRPSLLSRIFARKPKTVLTQPSAPEGSLETSEVNETKRKEEKVLHMPKMAEEKSSFDTTDVSSDKPLNDGKSQAETEPTEPVEKVTYEKEDKTEARPPKVTADIKKPVKLEMKTAGGFWHLFGHKKSGQNYKTNHHHLTEEKGKDAAERKGDNFDVNLMPAELIKDASTSLSKKLLVSGGLVMLAILLVAGIYGGMIWYESKIALESKQLSAQIKDLDQKISSLENDKNAAAALQKRLTVTRDLLNSHVYWTKFFDLLDKTTIDEVYYTNFSMTGRDKLVISAVGKDYNSVAKQLVAFQQASDFIKSVRIDAATAQIDKSMTIYQSVNFNINLEFLPNIFFKPIE